LRTAPSTICAGGSTEETGEHKAFLPSGNKDPYEGLNNKLFNPVDPAYFDGKQVELYPVFPHADATDMPNPDPLK